MAAVVMAGEPRPGSYTPGTWKPPVTVDGEKFEHVGSYSHEGDTGYYEWEHYYRSASGRWACDAGAAFGMSN